MSTRFWVSTSFWNWLVKRVFLIIFIMHSWLSRCSTARGSCSGLSLEGSTKVNAGKSFLFTEDSLKVENKEYLVDFVVTLYFISLCSNALSSWEWKVIFPISGQTSVLYPYWLILYISEQTSGLYWLNLLSNIFYTFNVANLGFWKIWPIFPIIGRTITL